MSLDVTLYHPVEEPVECPTCGHRKDELPEIFSANITHNLGKMAKAAGIYEVLWSPEVLGVSRAGFIVNILEVGLQKLKQDPDYYKQFNSPNGWGLYENFVPWIERYLEACKANPEAIIEVSR